MSNTNIDVILRRTEQLLYHNFNDYIKIVKCVFNGQMDTHNLLLYLIKLETLSNKFLECYSSILTTAKNNDLQDIIKMNDCISSNNIPDNNINLTYTKEYEIFITDICYISNTYKLTSKTFSAYVGYTLITNPRYKSYNLSKYVTNKRKVNDYKNDTADYLNSEVFNIPTDKIFSSYGKFVNSPLNTQIKDLCIGRDNEIQQLADILCKKKKKNALLLGNPGVGKTAIIDGLSEYLKSEDCPNKLRGKLIYSLNLTSMLSGAKYRGDFEERLNNLIQKVIEHDNIIIFIDEMHIINNAGAAEGAINASNILKPYLARDDIQIIGATTRDEYKELENDKAMVRRFSLIEVSEPSIKDTCIILEKLLPIYEQFHNIIIPINLISSMVNLANKYYRDRYFPDKAIDVLDQSCIYCKNHNKEDNTTLHKQDILNMLSNLLKVPANTITEDAITISNKTTEHLTKYILGQDDAIKQVLTIIKRNSLGLSDENKPLGSFLMVGPTGVGKTEMCKQLAKVLFTEESFIRLDMSEYMEKHSVSKLIGSPAGYVGYDNGGLLTELVKHNTHSIILLDEIEKAHKDVLNVFLQILDDGTLKDNKGNLIDFRNTIIIMTSNLGANEVTSNKLNIGFSTKSNKELKDDIYNNAIKNHFSPEFINRLDKIIIFNSLSQDTINKLINIELDTLKEKLAEKNINITYTNNTINQLQKDCYNETYGARFVKRTIIDKISNLIVDYIIDNNNITNITVDYIDDDYTCNIPIIID